MLRHGDGAARFIGIDAASAHVENRELRMPGQDLAPRADGQGLAFEGIAAAAAAAAPPAVAPASEGRGEKDPRQADHKARTARIDPIGEGASQLIEGRGRDKIGEGPEALGPQNAHIDGKRAFFFVQ